ncbi:hypothetical protein [Pseudomonas sp. Fl4BN1]|uniref:hypothetical protein n=1 Tax=Pseudomonas sp. Fl4BN1 TaxID=2697651 RepID=UPI0013772B3B|nr:hypothetical protein [Pseudomonas sp. Fl4BN1]NBF12940.1 hypothetical protein [Pseudomonas sp. Fl4BN1]
MKRMACSAWGVLSSEKGMACAEAGAVRNIWNIQIDIKNIQSFHMVSQCLVFRPYWYKPDRSGTNLFRLVPSLFQPVARPEQGYRLHATGLSAVFLNIVFRNVPGELEHCPVAGGHERRGVQLSGGSLFRLFRDVHSPEHVFNIGESKMPALNAPVRAEMSAQSLDFAHCWQQAVELVGLSSSVPMITTMRELSIAGGGLSPLLKRLHSLDTPRRALLLTMACMANPKRAEWLQGEVGLHFGQLTAADLGTEVFQVLVGLLASFPFTNRACECPSDWSELEQLYLSNDLEPHHG